MHAGFMGTQPLFNGMTIDYHNLSHHGRLPEGVDPALRLPPQDAPEHRLGLPRRGVGVAASATARPAFSIRVREAMPWASAKRSASWHCATVRISFAIASATDQRIVAPITTDSPA